jgi:hypothetical protein
MGRLHLFEITDQKWCPQSVRGVVTDYIRFGAEKWKLDVTMASFLLQEFIDHPEACQIVDLCTGTGGPWLRMLQFFEQAGLSIKVCFTDKYPNAPALEYLCSVFPGKCDFSLQSVDAAHVPGTFSGFRTIFSGFHHFRPTEARAILQDAVNCGQGIAIFETTQRTPWAMLNFMAVSFLMPFSVPFILPFRWSRLVWTYLVPIAPMVQLFDSFISCLRSYSVAELRELTRSINVKGYTWEVGETKLSSAPVPITYVRGYPD